MYTMIGDPWPVAPPSLMKSGSVGSNKYGGLLYPGFRALKEGTGSWELSGGVSICSTHAYDVGRPICDVWVDDRGVSRVGETSAIC